MVVWLRSKAQDEQKTQHGEPGADETHSWQDECENCSKAHWVFFYIRMWKNDVDVFFLSVSTNKLNLTIDYLPALSFFLSSPFPFVVVVTDLSMCNRVRSGTVTSWTNRPNLRWLRALPSCSLSAVCVGKSTKLVAPARSSRTPATPWTLARHCHRDLRRYTAENHTHNYSIIQHGLAIFHFDICLHQRLSPDMLGDEGFFDLLSRFQSNRMDDQRCSIQDKGSRLSLNRGPESPPRAIRKCESIHSYMSTMILLVIWFPL